VKAHGNRPGGRLSQLGSGPERVNGAVSFLLPFASPEPLVFRRRGVEKVPIRYEVRGELLNADAILDMGTLS